MAVRATVGVLAVVALVGCGGNPATDGGADVAPTDARADTAVDGPMPMDAQPDAPTPMDARPDAPAADVPADAAVDTAIDAADVPADAPADVVAPSDVACPSGATRCGAACVDLTSSAAHCGDCAHACDAGEACVASACTAVAAPRLIAPLSTATATSQTPTLHWSLPAGTDGAQVDLCSDRACTRPVATFAASGDHGAAPHLGAGVYFWRAHGTLGGVVGTATSAVWQFHVGARSASVDTSWGTTPDVDGDGYADVVVGAWGLGILAGQAFVYTGNGRGLAATPTAFHSPDGGGFGIGVASAGDVDGDGFADVIVGASAALGEGRAYVFRGSASGLVTAAPTVLPAPDGAGSHFGTSVASAGDVNGDGYADVIVGAYGVASNTGRAYVYLGGASGLATTPATTLAAPAGAGSLFGLPVVSVGDTDGDGFPELAVGASGTHGGAGSAYVYSTTRAGGVPATPTLTYDGTDGANALFGTIASAGDLNGDGYADAVVGAEQAASHDGRAYVYLGGMHGLPSTPTATLFPPDPGGDFGGALGSAGDVDGDGFGDLIVGAYTFNTSTGRAYLYMGSATAPTTAAFAPTVTLTGPDGMGGDFGVAVGSAGDTNRDGFADLLVGAPGAGGSEQGALYVFDGSASGLATTPAATLTGAATPQGAVGDSFAVAE